MVSMASKPLIDSKISPEHIYDAFLTYVSVLNGIAESAGFRGETLDETVKTILKTAKAFQDADRKKE